MEIPVSPIFQGLTQEEWQELESALVGKIQQVEKGQVIFRRGDIPREMGLVLSGGVRIESVDLWGNRSILSHVGPGQVFAETYALTGSPLLVDAVAAVDSQILPMDLRPLLGDETFSQPWRQSCCETW